MSNSGDELEAPVAPRSVKRSKASVLETVKASPEPKKATPQKQATPKAAAAKKSATKKTAVSEETPAEEAPAEPRVVDFIDTEEVERESARKVAAKEKAMAAAKGKKGKKQQAARNAYDSDSDAGDGSGSGDDDDVVVQDGYGAEDSDGNEVGDEEAEEDEDDEDDEEKVKGARAPTEGGGMADAFMRILGQKLPEEKAGAPVLAKRTTKMMKEAEAEKIAAKAARVAQTTNRAFKETGLHEPSHLDIEVERSLRRVATRGVVALFNAITQHQHASAEAAAGGAAGGAGKSTARDVKQLSKDNFLQMLKTKGGAAVGTAAGAGAGAGGEGGGAGSVGGASAWLRDDFMTGGRGKSIKDWERHEHQGGSDDDEGGAGGGGGGGSSEDEDEDDGPAWSDEEAADGEKRGGKDTKAARAGAKAGDELTQKSKRKAAKTKKPRR